MTREQARELLPIIQAYAQGKTIQVSFKDCLCRWEDYNGSVPDFSNPNIQWRVKPEPGEWWMVMGFKGDVLQVCESKEKAQNTQWAYGKIIHVHEVLE